MLSTLGPIVLILEGGYNLSSTAHSTEQAIRVLLGEQAPPLRPAQHDLSRQAYRSIVRTLQAQSQYWASAREQLSAFVAQYESLVQRSPSPQGSDAGSSHGNAGSDDQDRITDAADELLFRGATCEMQTVGEPEDPMEDDMHSSPLTFAGQAPHASDLVHSSPLSAGGIQLAAVGVDPHGEAHGVDGVVDGMEMEGAPSDLGDMRLSSELRSVMQDDGFLLGPSSTISMAGNMSGSLEFGRFDQGWQR